MTEDNKLCSDAIKVVFMGTPEFAVPSLQKLISRGYNIVSVITQPDKPAGRKMLITAPPVKNIALDSGLKVLQPESMKSEETYNELKKLEPDIIVTAAYGKILPTRILNLPKYGCINVHASLLPKYRGAAPIHMCILNGDIETGVTIMEMDEGMDTGNIVADVVVKIDPHINTGTLTRILAVEGAELLGDILPAYLSGLIKSRQQVETEASVVRPVKKEDAKLDFSATATTVHNIIRAMNPWPVAYAYYRDKRLKIFASEIHSDLPFSTPGIHNLNCPGVIIVSPDRRRLFVVCGEGFVEILTLQSEGSRCMTHDECAHNFTTGDILS